MYFFKKKENISLFATDLLAIPSPWLRLFPPPRPKWPLAPSVAARQPGWAAHVALTGLVAGQWKHLGMVFFETFCQLVS